MEPVGLAVGVAGLAGLFSACIDCFNIIQQGRYLGRDYFILETKYMNQRLRLLTWGRACGLGGPTPGSNSISWSEDIRTAVSETLIRIASLFQDHRALRKRYGLSMDHSASDGTMSATNMLGALTSKLRATGLAVADSPVFTSLPGRSFAKRPSVQASFRWAVDDKRKFAELVQHLKDFIDDLEALTVDLNIPQRQRELIQAEVEHISDPVELETIEQARMGCADAVADAASLRLFQIGMTDGPRDTSPPAAEGASPVTDTTSTVVSENDWDMVKSESTPETGCSAPFYQVLHRVACETQPPKIFFDAPSYQHCPETETDSQWLVVDADSPFRDPAPLHLSGQHPLPNFKSFLRRNRTWLYFIVFKDYRCSHDVDEPRDSSPSETNIYLVSLSLCNRLNKRTSWQSTTFLLHPNTELRYPHSWFYHNRKELTDPLHLKRPLTQAQHVVETLLEFVRDSMSELYDFFDNSFGDRPTMRYIRWHELPLLFIHRPDEILVERVQGKFRAFAMAGPPRTTWTEGDETAEVFEIPVRRSYHVKEGVSCCHRGPSRLQIPRSIFTKPSVYYPGYIDPILADLPVVPIRFTPGDRVKQLIERGKKAAEFKRDYGFVVYRDLVSETVRPHFSSHVDVAPGNVNRQYLQFEYTLTSPHQMNGEYIIDLKMYEWFQTNEQHPDGRSETIPRSRWRGARPDPEFMTDDDYLCMPHVMWGFHLRDHVWRELLVENAEIPIWPEAKIEGLLIGKEACDALQRLFGPMQKPSWHSWCQNNGINEDSAKIFTCFHGMAVEAALNVVSRITKRPLYRIRLSGQTEELDTVFRKARGLNTKWGCIIVIEDLLEACAAHSQTAARLNSVILPLVRFLDSIGGIVVFVLSSTMVAGDPTEIVDQHIRQRTCKTFEFQPQDSYAQTRGQLWVECIANRLESRDNFPTYEVSEKLQELAKLQLTWSCICSIVFATVPEGMRPDKIDWGLVADLAQQQHDRKVNVRSNTRR